MNEALSWFSATFETALEPAAAAIALAQDTAEARFGVS